MKQRLRYLMSTTALVVALPVLSGVSSTPLAAQQSYPPQQAAKTQPQPVDVNKLAKEVAALAAQVAAIDWNTALAQLTALQAWRTDVEARLVAQDAKLADNATQIAALRAQVVQLAAQLAALTPPVPTPPVPTPAPIPPPVVVTPPPVVVTPPDPLPVPPVVVVPPDPAPPVVVTPPAPLPAPPPSGTLQHGLITPAAAAFLTSTIYGGPGPSYPRQFTWDLARGVVRMSRSATDEMGLQPKVELWRAGKLMGTWSQLTGDNYSCFDRDRSNDPGSAASLACGGPLGGLYSAWLPGDEIRIYPAVYRESVNLAPQMKTVLRDITLTKDSTVVVAATTVNLRVGDVVQDYNWTVFPISTHVVSIDSPTQFTVDKPALIGGPTALYVYKNVDLTVRAMYQDVDGVPTKPVILLDDKFDDTAGVGKGMLMMYGNSPGDITDLVWDGVDLIAPRPPYGQTTWVETNEPFAFVYIGSEINGNVTIKNARIKGGMYVNRPGGADGILSGNPNQWRDNTGTLTLENNECAEIGGQSGPSHCAYIGESKHLKVVARHNWFHDIDNGHALKLRTIDNVIDGNYLQGGNPPEGSVYGESNLADLPCGGKLTMRNNIVTKRHNFEAQNPVEVFYNEDKMCADVYHWEGQLDQPVVIENNSLFTWAMTTYGGQLGGSHNMAFGFFGRPVESGTYPEGTTARQYSKPGDPFFPTKDFKLAYNLFVGFIPYATWDGTENDWVRDDLPGVGPNVMAGWPEITTGLTLKDDIPGDPSIIGTETYAHEASSTTRKLTTVGALDADPTGTLLVPGPEIAFIAMTPYVPSGGSSKLRLYTTGAAGCTASGGWSGPKDPSSTEETVTPPPGGPTDYVITCTDAAGRSSTEKVTVSAIDPPVIDVFGPASAPSSGPGQPVTVRWDARNANYCDLSHGMNSSGNRPHGQATIRPTQTVTIGLSCAGIGGSTEIKKLQVVVPGTVELPTAWIVTSPLWIEKASGQVSTLRWDCVAGDCVGTNFDTDGQLSGSITVKPDAFTTYSVESRGPGGVSRPISSWVNPY